MKEFKINLGVYIVSLFLVMLMSGLAVFYWQNKNNRFEMEENKTVVPTITQPVVKTTTSEGDKEKIKQMLIQKWFNSLSQSEKEEKFLEEVEINIKKLEENFSMGTANAVERGGYVWIAKK